MFREAGGDLALTKTSLLFSFECQPVGIRTTVDLHNKNGEVFTKTRSPEASLSFKGLVTEQTNVKCPIKEHDKHHDKLKILLYSGITA